jgi:4-amino-4-deoxy-L-arabinose transferase-like glycosyltransferase
MKINHKSIFTAAIILFILGVNLFLGIPRLSTFSAVDEPYWTYGRISKFWTAVSQQKWKSTDVNDKPGITVAIISGLGLLKYDPMPYKALRGEIKTDQQLKDMDAINFYFRLPIFLFCTLMLLAFYFFIKKLFGNTIALLSFIFIGLSPIIFGISLIINPDSLLWIFLPLSLLSYLVFQKEGKKSYLFASGIFLGLSLLTKYVANILYIFLFALPFLEYIFLEKKPELTAYLKKSALNYLIIALVSMATFYVLYPATWTHPDVLLKGTFLSKAFEKTWPIFASLIALIALDVFLLKSKVMNWILSFFSKYKTLLVRIFLAAFLFIIAFVFIDVYSGMKPFNIEAILSSPKGIGAPTIFASYAGAILADTYSLIFGISPLALLGLLAALIFSFKKKADYSGESAVIFSFSVFILLYYFASSVNDVAATVRYQITLYPLAFIISAIGIARLAGLFKKYIPEMLVFIVVLAISAVGVFSVRPFYFTYASSLLPQNYLLNIKDMGDGSYEAAYYLNSLPNPQSISIWSDKGAVCAEFLGRCDISFNKKDLRGKKYDYFVISMGRMSRSLKIAKSANEIIDFRKLYSSDEYAQKIILGGRADNYVKVVPAEALAK